MFHAAMSSEPCDLIRFMTTPNLIQSGDPTPAYFRQTGGLRWHARALKNWRLHEPFRREVHAFLAHWQPPTADVVLVGPSAGWSLPSSFLSRFSRLTFIELDRAAPLFFRLRHGRILRANERSSRWILGDFTVHLRPVIEAQPGCAVLFCNVLGQLGLERADYESQLAVLPQSLSGHPWASFHDRFSTAIAQSQLPALDAFSTDQPLDARALQNLGLTGQWTDHGTGQLLMPGVMRRYIPWQITSRRFHWVEAGSVG